MQLSMQFNWPTGENTVGVSLGTINIEDVKKEFRLGVITKANPEGVHWHNAGWVAGEEIHDQMKCKVDRGDKVIVQYRTLGEENPSGKVVIDTEQEWPAEAHGNAMTHMGWDF